MNGKTAVVTGGSEGIGLATAVLYLCRDATFITGTSLLMDGGRRMVA